VEFVVVELRLRAMLLCIILLGRWVRCRCLVRSKLVGAALGEMVVAAEVELWVSPSFFCVLLSSFVDVMTTTVIPHTCGVV